jgi:maltose O-acetyltransferase
MLAGELYDASAPEIQAELEATHQWLARYNAPLDMAPSDRHHC